MLSTSGISGELGDTAWASCATALSGAKPTNTRATRTAGNQRQGRGRGGFTRLPTVVRGRKEVEVRVNVCPARYADTTCVTADNLFARFIGYT